MNMAIENLLNCHKSVKHKASQRKWLRRVRRGVQKKYRAPRLSKNKNEKKEVSSHKVGVVLYTT